MTGPSVVLHESAVLFTRLFFVDVELEVFRYSSSVCVNQRSGIVARKIDHVEFVLVRSTATRD
jgi:hypothetical protein